MGTIIFIILIFLLSIALYFSGNKIMKSDSSKSELKFGSLLKKISFGIGFIGFIIILIDSTTVISPGNTGVVTFFGNVSNKPLQSGFHFINPLSSIEEIDIKTQVYTMSHKTNEGQVKGDDAIYILTKDGLQLGLEITVQWRLLESNVPKIYRTIGLDYEEKIVRPEIRSVIRDNAVKYFSTDIYSSNRANFVSDVSENLKKVFTARGFIMEQFLLRDVQLPQKVQNAINEKLAAEQESQKMEWVLSKEKKEAERKVVEAQGIRNAQNIITDGLTPAYIKWKYLHTLEIMSKSGNTTFMIVPNEASNVTSMVNFNNK